MTADRPTAGHHSFASDNWAGVHPDVLAAVVAANVGHAPAYGADPVTERAAALFKQHFGDDAEVFFVFNGTGCQRGRAPVTPAALRGGDLRRRRPHQRRRVRCPRAVPRAASWWPYPPPTES